jgi:hypothetical protein
MALLARVSSTQLVARLLDEPELVSVVQALEAPVLRALVEHVGLEDAGELVALATSEQLERIFDDDLWHAAGPGEDERFDPKRFALWLEVLLGVGEAHAIERVAAMDEDLLALGLSNQVLVIDIDALATTVSEATDDDYVQLEKTLEGCLYEELEEFRVIARDAATWDPIVNLLVALDRDHHALLRRLLERCCAIAAEHIEENGGLYEVLTSAEMLESDVAFDREQRREREGFVAPSAAASFLRLARVTPLAELIADEAPDPVTKAHFRAAGAAASAPNAAVGPSAQVPPTAKVQAVLRELRAAGVIDEAPPAPRRRLAASTSAEHGTLRRAIEGLRGDHPALRRALEELAYLVNVLLAAHGGVGRGLRAIEVSEIVTAVCELGLARLLGRERRTDEHLARVLAERGVVGAFRVGWHLVGGDDWSAEGLRGAAKAANEAKKARPAKKEPRAGKAKQAPRDK